MKRKQDTSDWEDINDMLTDEGREAIKVDQVLIFGETEAEQRHFKVMKKTKKHLWIKPIRLLRPEEVEIE